MGFDIDVGDCVKVKERRKNFLLLDIDSSWRLRPHGSMNRCGAQNGHLEVLKYLREEAKAPWDNANKHLECLPTPSKKKCTG